MSLSLPSDDLAAASRSPFVPLPLSAAAPEHYVHRVGAPPPPAISAPAAENDESYSYLDRILAMSNPLSWRSQSRQALSAVVFVAAFATFVGVFPGHSDGGLWPIYVPEHYGLRNSQNLLDPYSFAHFGHGILSYYAFGSFGRAGVSETEGLIKTLLSALAFEMVENTHLLIQLFRENSGTSEQYRGDSAINVFGDLFSCALGYNFAGYLSAWTAPWLPLVVFALIEATLAVVVRDNMFLMGLQLIYPIERIKSWQNEIVPKSFKKAMGGLKSNDSISELEDYWVRKYYPSEKYKLPEISESLLNPRVHYLRGWN